MKDNLKHLILPVFILVAAFSRLIPHPVNVTPIAAMGLFGAAYFNRKYLAFIIPLISLFLSDLVINNTIMAGYFGKFTVFYPGAGFVYGGFVLITFIGFFLLKKVKTGNIILATLIASTVFFLISNLGTFLSGTLYPHTWQGLVACYTAALPFFGNSIIGDLFYAGVLFGGFELVKASFPSLAKHSNS